MNKYIHFTVSFLFFISIIYKINVLSTAMYLTIVYMILKYIFNYLEDINSRSKLETLHKLEEDIKQIEYKKQNE